MLEKWDSPNQYVRDAFGTVPIFPYEGYEILLVAGMLLHLLVMLLVCYEFYK